MLFRSCGNKSLDECELVLGLLPIGCRIIILNFLDHAGLVAASIVSKQFHQDCWYDGVQNKIITVYELRPRAIPGQYRLRFSTAAALLGRLYHNQVSNNKKFARYRHLRVDSINDFYAIHEADITAIVVRMSNENIRIDGISSLDISVPAQTCVDRSIVGPIVSLLPNVREIDFSNVVLVQQHGPGRSRTTRSSISFVDNPLLEKVTWHRGENLTMEGFEFLSCPNLRELIVDDSIFLIKLVTFLRLADTSYDSNILFPHCASIERLSIRGAKRRIVGPGQFATEDTVPILQRILIKFVRNAPPSLRWFRSDLTKENISMLQRERPEIQFLN
mgnify:CR=1 FL=1